MRLIDADAMREKILRGDIVVEGGLTGEEAEYTLCELLKIEPTADAVPVDVFMTVLERYRNAEESCIWEYSGSINEDKKLLNKELSKLMKAAGLEVKKGLLLEVYDD